MELKKSLREFFKDLTFEEEEHRYYVKGILLEKSVSGIVNEFAEKFDTHSKSLGMAKSLGISQEEVLADWAQKNKEAIDKGNKTHRFGELYALDRSLIPTTKEEKAVVKFWKDLPDFVEVVDVELEMYHKDYFFGGTGDIVLRNKNTGKLIVGDYKTNKDLFKNYKGQKLLGPFGHLLDNPFNKYQIQLSLYDILLSQTGEEVSSRKIIWIKPDGTYLIYDCADYTMTLSNYLKNSYGSGYNW